MFVKLSFTFNIRIDRKKNDLVPIYLFIIHNRKILKKYNTGFVIPESEWVKKKNKTLDININRLMHDLEVALRKELQAYIDKDIFPDNYIITEALNNLYGDHENKGMHFFLEHFREYIALQPGSKRFLKGVYDVIEAFLNHKDIPVSSIDYKFLQQLENHYIFEKSYERSTANKRHSTIKRILNDAIKKKYITENPYDDFELKPYHSEIEPLVEQDIEKINNAELNKFLYKTREVFQFSLYTGVSYKDGQDLLPIDMYEENIDGKIVYMISNRRVKTKNYFIVPLFGIALEIAFKYIPQGRLLPKQTNKTVNTNLKEIQKIAGVKTNLNHHLARHTFATTIGMDNNVDIAVMQKMLGHAKITTTQQYSKVRSKTIAKNVDKMDKK